MGAACTPRREGKQRTSTRPGKLLPRRAPRSLERRRRRRRRPGAGPSPVLREQAGLTAVPHSAGSRAALPGAKVEGEVSRARPPHSRPRPPAFSRGATPPLPPLRPRGLGHRRRPSCLHRPAPHTAAAAFSPTQSRCRLSRRHLLRRSLISLEHLPATGHGETETPAAPAGNSPATARGGPGGQSTSGFSAIEQRPLGSFCNPLPAPPSFPAPPPAPPPRAPIGTPRVSPLLSVC